MPSCWSSRVELDRWVIAREELVDGFQGQREFSAAPLDEGAGLAAVGPDQGEVAVQAAQPRK